MCANHDRSERTIAFSNCRAAFNCAGPGILPTPQSVVTTGELAPTLQPAVAKPNAAITTATSDANNNTDNNNDTMPLQNTEAEQLLTTWRQQVQQNNLAQHTTWRRLLYFIDDKKPFGKGKLKVSSMTKTF